MSNTLTYKFLTDVGIVSNNGRLEVYLKNAKVDWKTKYGKFVLGLQGLNVFEVQKNTWGYRSIDKTAMNRNKWASSADMGIGYYQKYKELNYSILVTNGAGYKNHEDDSYKKFSAQAFYGPSKLNFKTGWNIGGVVTYESYTNNDYKIVEGIFGGFSSGIIRVGAEFDKLFNSGLDESIKIVSGYVNIELNNRFNIFGRIDNLSNSDYVNNYFIAGISVIPEKGLKIMPNIRYISNSDIKNIIKYNLNFEFKI
ncbi:MAG: hypothetical protein GWP19_13815 [Planctomycetia bacterium]|nr:hypothetical protein [Planctomycetia bacterium]